VSNENIIALMAKGLREGLPHPGDRDNNQSPQLITFPGMRMHGVPQQVLDQLAQEAGLPSSDMPRLVAEAMVNLIQTDGESEIVLRSELASLRQARAELSELRETPSEEVE